MASRGSRRLWTGREYLVDTYQLLDIQTYVCSFVLICMHACTKSGLFVSLTCIFGSVNALRAYIYTYIDSDISMYVHIYTLTYKYILLLESFWCIFYLFSST